MRRIVAPGVVAFRGLSLAALAVAALAISVLVGPVAASAQTTTGSITLEASRNRIASGDAVELSGSISPPSQDQTVEIRDDADAVAGTATTNAAGDFSIRLEPEVTRTYRAVWGSAVSEPVTVEVRSALTVRMSAVRLFDEVVVRGRVEPARPGEGVDVSLQVGGRVVDERRVRMGAAGGFRVTFRVMAPGTYRARASFEGDRATTQADATPLPGLRAGSHGVYVELLERRLVELHYRLAGAADGDYDLRTSDAVVAFHKVQRTSRVGTVDAATWRALADPKVPHPRHGWHGFHFEVDQTRQVLYAVVDGDVDAILHVSTGRAGTPTRDGVFRVVRKIAGYSANRLYYPSYFDGNRALHGWPEVPTYPASHGCVRIPYWNALWVYDRADYGTRVAVYH